MTFLNYVKSNLTSLPYPFGKLVSLVPYSYRPGLSTIYKSRTKQCALLERESLSIQQNFVYEKIKKIALFSQINVPFYSDLYKQNNVDVSRFNRFEDIFELPVVTKNDLQSVPLDYRSFFKKGMMKVNTGGSSGKPLEFYIESDSIPHEWAHMHRVWSKLGFKQSDLRLVFAGRSNVQDVITYDSARHQLNVDIYAGWEVLANKLLTSFKYFSPSYIHGYPSSIFDFVIWLSTNNHPLLKVLKHHIKGVF